MDGSQAEGTPVRGTDNTAWRDEVSAVSPSELTADVYLRSLSPPVGVHDGQVAQIDRLSALSAADSLGALRVSVWGERLCTCDTCAGTGAGQAALDRVEQFERWAERADAPVTLPFERRVVRSGYTSSTQKVLIPPRVLLAVYDRTSLLGVFPHAAGDTQVSVRDAIGAIEAAVATDRGPPVCQ